MAQLPNQLFPEWINYAGYAQEVLWAFMMLLEA